MAPGSHRTIRRPHEPPGSPRKLQELPGSPRRLQGPTRSPRSSQEAPGATREFQEAPGPPGGFRRATRKPQEPPGGLRTTRSSLSCPLYCPLLALLAHGCNLQRRKPGPTPAIMLSIHVMGPWVGGVVDLGCVFIYAHVFFYSIRVLSTLNPKP